MRVTEVTNTDGIMCAQLIRLLEHATWASTSSKDAEAIVETKKWVAALAGTLASELRGKKEESPSFRVTQVGALSPSPPLSSKKSKKGK